MPIGFHKDEYNEEEAVSDEGRIGKLIEELIQACQDAGLPLTGAVCYRNDSKTHGLRMFGHAPKHTLPPDMAAAKFAMEDDELAARVIAMKIASDMGVPMGNMPSLERILGIPQEEDESDADTTVSY